MDSPAATPTAAPAPMPRFQPARVTSAAASTRPRDILRISTRDSAIRTEHTSVSRPAAWGMERAGCSRASCQTEKARR